MRDSKLLPIRLALAAFLLFLIFGQPLHKRIKIFRILGKKLEVRSDSRIKVQVYPSARLSKAYATYDSKTSLL